MELSPTHEATPWSPDSDPHGVPCPPQVRDPKAWVQMYGLSESDNLPSGTLDVYLSRGWCRLEIVAALCPKRFEGSGSWRPGPINMRYRYHHDPAHAGVGRRITAADLLDPREGMRPFQAHVSHRVATLSQLKARALL